MKNFPIIWSDAANEDLEKIYQYFCCINSEIAIHKITKILLEIEEKIGLAVWQKDEFDNRFRRFFILNANYRVLYFTEKECYTIVRIYSTKQKI